MPPERSETFEEIYCRLMDETVRELGLSALPHGLTDREIRILRRMAEKAKTVPVYYQERLREIDALERDRVDSDRAVSVASRG